MARDRGVSRSATVFLGPDFEAPPTTRRDTLFFDSIDEALRYAVEQIPAKRQTGTYIRLEADHSIIEWKQIRTMYDQLG
jgi:hypothetical protein